MIIPDVNILVYAFHSAAPQHKPAQQWLSSALNRHETIGLLDVVATGVLDKVFKPGSSLEGGEVDGPEIV